MIDVGQVWRGPQRTWECVRTLGEIQPGEQLRVWRVVRGPRRDVGREAQFGDRYVGQNMTRLTAP